MPTQRISHWGLMGTWSRNSWNSNYIIQYIPTESKANVYTVTAIGAVNLIMKPLVQLVPILCLESKTEDTEQVAIQQI